MNDDVIYCCVLGLCCSFSVESSKRRKAMTQLLEKHGMDEKDAEKYAPLVLTALHPVFESMQPFVTFVSKAARGADFKE